MIGWLVALVLLALFLFLKVGVRFLWNSDTSILKIRVGFLRFSLATGEKKKKKPKKKKTENRPTAQVTGQAPSEGKAKQQKKPMSPALKSWIRAVLERRGELLALIGKVLKSPTLDLLRLHIAAGGDDAELQYGKICAGLGAGLPVLYNIFRVKKDEIQVICRYDLPKMEIMAEVEATIMIYEVFAIIGAVIGLLIKIYLTKKRNDKAVRTV